MPFERIKTLQQPLARWKTSPHAILGTFVRFNRAITQIRGAQPQGLVPDQVFQPQIALLIHYSAVGLARRLCNLYVGCAPSPASGGTMLSPCTGVRARSRK